MQWPKWPEIMHLTGDIVDVRLVQLTTVLPDIEQETITIKSSQEILENANQTFCLQNSMILLCLKKRDDETKTRKPNTAVQLFHP
jgi:hypothetical protein